MRKFVLLIFILGFINCKPEKENSLAENQKKIINENLNLILTPDLSNRINVHTTHKIVHDTVLFKEFYKSYFPDIYRSNGRVIGQKDELSFLFTNSNIIKEAKIKPEILNFDFSEFNDGTRIQYLVSHNNFPSQYDVDKRMAISELKNLYDKLNKRSAGADIYNFLSQGINNSIIKEDEKPVKIDNSIIYNNQRNILILFTDGYIEAGVYGSENCEGEKCYFLDKPKIDEFRNEFKRSGSNDLKSFFYNSGYGIIPVNNNNLKNLEIIVVELYDRSLARSGSQREIPNDMEIIKLFWSDWLLKSGVKKSKLFSTVQTVEEFKININNFIDRDN